MPDETPPLDVTRLEAIKLADPSLDVGEEIGRGETTTIMAATREGVACVLKISRMIEGMRAELRAFTHLCGIEGVPTIRKSYTNNDADEIVIGLLMPKIEGQNIDDYLTANPDKIADFFVALRKLIQRIHDRGHLLPADWLKPGNVLVTSDSKPNIVDLGEPQTMNQNAIRMEEEIKTDLRSLHAKIGEYRSILAGWKNRKQRKRLEDLMLKDFSDHP